MSLIVHFSKSKVLDSELELDCTVAETEAKKMCHGHEFILKDS